MDRGGRRLALRGVRRVNRVGPERVLARGGAAVMGLPPEGERHVAIAHVAQVLRQNVDMPPHQVERVGPVGMQGDRRRRRRVVAQKQADMAQFLRRKRDFDRTALHLADRMGDGLGGLTADIGGCRALRAVLRGRAVGDVLRLRPGRSGGNGWQRRRARPGAVRTRHRGITGHGRHEGRVARPRSVQHRRTFRGRGRVLPPPLIGGKFGQLGNHRAGLVVFCLPDRRRGALAGTFGRCLAAFRRKPTRLSVRGGCRWLAVRRIPGFRKRRRFCHQIRLAGFGGHRDCRFGFDDRVDGVANLRGARGQPRLAPISRQSLFQRHLTLGPVRRRAFPCARCGHRHRRRHPRETGREGRRIVPLHVPRLGAVGRIFRRRRGGLRPNRDEHCGRDFHL